MKNDQTQDIRRRPLKPFTTEEVLYRRRCDDDTVEPGYEAKVAGVAIAVLARTAGDGRKTLIVNLRTRFIAKRNSGSVFTYWATRNLTVFAWTKNNLLIRREQRDRHWSTSRCWSEDDEHPEWTHGLNALKEYAGTAVLTRRTFNKITKDARAFLGTPPSFSDRHPLVDYEACIGNPTMHLQRSSSVFFPCRDATTPAQVAHTLFGTRRCTKPLVAEVARAIDNLHFTALEFLAHFRGLVPVEYIVNALRTINEGGHVRMTSYNRNLIRQILLRTPEAALKRFLKQHPNALVTSLDDAAQHMSVWNRDIEALPQFITARGQRNLRSATDLEALIETLPKLKYRYAPGQQTALVLHYEKESRQQMDQYNAIMRYQGRPEIDYDVWNDVEFQATATDLIREIHDQWQTENERLENARLEHRREERLKLDAARHAWASQTETLLDGQQIPGSAYTVTVARTEDDLVIWGAVMNHCIASYSHELGFDVFLAIQQDETIILNVQIAQDGVVQILGKFNKDMDRVVSAEDESHIATWLASQQIELHPSTVGISAALRKRLSSNARS